MTVTPLTALPPRTYADLKRKLTVLTAPPTEPLDALTVATLNGGMDASCRVAKDGTRLSATGSETVEDSAICEPNGASAPGRSNYEAVLNIYRFFSDTNKGQADEVGDALFQAAKVKGTPLYIVESQTAKDWDEPWEAGDEYSVFVVTTDNWQRPSDQHAGFIKVTVPLFVSNAELNGVVAAGA